MTSKISFFKIATDDLRHRIWMIALSCLGSLLALPVFFLMLNGRYLRAYQLWQEYLANKTYVFENNYELLSLYQSHLVGYTLIPSGVILILGALIVGIWGFRYLYSRNMADMYHAMPIKRDHLFIIVYLNGFLIWIIPLLIGLLFTLLLMFVNLARYGHADQFALLLPYAGRFLLICLLAFFTVYNFCVLCVMLCGNVFNTICLTCIGGVLINALILLHSLYSHYFFHFYNGLPFDIEKFSWMSPLVNSILLLAEATLENLILQGESHIFSIDAGYLCISTLVIIACFVGSLLLHRKRSSELAEHGLANRPVQHIVRVLSSIIAGASCALLLYYIMDNQTGWLLFGCVLGAFLAFGILDIIFHMDFRAFGKHKLEMLCTILLTCALLFVYKCDIFGFEKRIPSQKAIQSATIDIAGLDTEEIGVLSSANSDAIYRLLERLTDDQHVIRNDEVLYDRSDFVGDIWIDLTLKNGLSFHRNYRLLDSDKEYVAALIDTEEFRNAYYPCSSGLLGTPDHMNLNTISSDYYGISLDYLTEEQRAKVMEAYSHDFIKHYSLDYLSDHMYIATIHVNYSTYDRTLDPDLYDSASSTGYYLNLYEDYEETLNLLKELCDDLTLTPDELNIKSITLQPSIGAFPSKDVLYSYFGVPGYSDYDTFLDTAWDKYGETYVEGEYLLTIDDPEKIDQLIPILHIGEGFASPFESNYYIYAGEMTLSNRYDLSFYVKKGELGKEWIDQIDLIPYDSYYE